MNVSVSVYRSELVVGDVYTEPAFPAIMLIVVQITPVAVFSRCTCHPERGEHYRLRTGRVNKLLPRPCDSCGVGIPANHTVYGLGSIDDPFRVCATCYQKAEG